MAIIKLSELPPPTPYTDDEINRLILASRENGQAGVTLDAGRLTDKQQAELHNGGYGFWWGDKRENTLRISWR